MMDGNARREAGGRAAMDGPGPAPRLSIIKFKLRPIPIKYLRVFVFLAVSTHYGTYRV